VDRFGNGVSSNSNGCAADDHQRASAAKFFGARWRAVRLCWSIFVRHHHGDGGLRVVNVECAASGDEFDKPRCAIVVADIERDRDAVNTWRARMIPNLVIQRHPTSARLVLAGHVRGTVT